MNNSDNNKLTISGIKKQEDIIIPIKEYLEKITFIIRNKIFTSGANSNYLNKILETSEASKMLRTILLLYTAKSTGGISDKHLRASAGIEMFHTASLIHDDIIDQSDSRRSDFTFNAQFGNKTAVLLGDLVLSLGLQLFASLNDSSIMNLITGSMETVVHGELNQLNNKFPSENEYINTIDKKTGTLFGLSMFLGSYLNKCPVEKTSIWNNAGLLIGRSFQIMDDISDFKIIPGSKNSSNNDLKNGILTLPLIYLLDNLNENDRNSILGNISQPESGFIRDKIVDSGALEKVHVKTKCFLDEALTTISKVSDNETFGVFSKITEMIGNEIYL